MTACTATPWPSPSQSWKGGLTWSVDGVQAVSTFTLPLIRKISFPPALPEGPLFRNRMLPIPPTSAGRCRAAAADLKGEREPRHVRGKTIAVHLENAEVPADEFPAFLTRADTLLKTLKFAG